MPNGAPTAAGWLNLSHELRTPANAIMGHVELLLSGALGPLSSEMRASLGDIQRAGLGLLNQVDRVIEVGQELPCPNFSSSDIDLLADLLDDAWAKADNTRDDRIETSLPDVRSPQEHQPTRWLRLAATLLTSLGVRPPRSEGPAGAPPLPSLCEFHHSHLSELRLPYPVSERADFSLTLTMLESALMMTGGILEHRPGELFLIWPARTFRSYSERATA